MFLLTLVLESFVKVKSILFMSLTYLFLLGIQFFVLGCFRWSFDETVTHFIYQGRPNDTNREYKSVKERGVHIVSEHWLLEVSHTFFSPPC